MSISNVGTNIRDSQDEKIRLIKQAQAGDTLAFEELYASYAQIILFFTKKYLWVHEAVEDVAQTAVLNMLSGIKDLREPAAFDGWLHSLVKNACHNHNKMHSRNRDNLTDDETAVELLEANDEYIPEESLLKSELDGEIIEAMAKLPESYRQSLYLYYYKQMSYAEVAEKLEITASTVSTNIMKGKAKLKELLEKTSNAGGDMDLLRGVAIGPALAHAFFEDEVGVNVGASEVSDFVKATNGKIDAQASTLGQPKNPRTMNKLGLGNGTIAAILVAAAVVIASVVILVNPLEPGPTSSNIGTDMETPVTTSPISEAAVEIVMVSSDDSPTDILNPISASLETDNGTAGDWRIISEDGATTYSGNGASFSDELLLLKSGKYTVEWINIRDDGSIATATRIFEIRR
jgi:RNA polymerase sigma-70 factor (ECF subfamily)